MWLPLFPQEVSVYPVGLLQLWPCASILVSWPGSPATLDRTSGLAVTEKLPAVRLDIFSAGGSSVTGAPVAVLSVPPLDVPPGAVHAAVGGGICDLGGVHGRVPGPTVAPSEGECVRREGVRVRLYTGTGGISGAPGRGHAVASSNGMTSGAFALMLADRCRFTEAEAGLTCTLVIHLC